MVYFYSAVYSEFERFLELGFNFSSDFLRSVAVSKIDDNDRIYRSDHTDARSRNKLCDLITYDCVRLF